jgi:hypothetical protein
VGVVEFERHGINADSTAGNGCVLPFSDDIVLRDSVAIENGGDGFYCKGTDCNASYMAGNQFYYNFLRGVEDQSSLGNTWVGNNISNNGHLWAATTTPATKTISTISRALSGGSSIVSVVLSAADTNLKQGSCVVIAGVTDATFNSPAGQCFFITTFTDSAHFQYEQPGAPANASSSGGTERMGKFSEVYLSAGVDDGAVKFGTQGSIWSAALFSNYVEGGQDCKFGTTVLNLGGASQPTCATVNDWKGMFITTNGIAGGPATNITGFTNEIDNNLSVRFKSGKTSDFNITTNWQDHNGTNGWQQIVTPAAVGGAVQFFRGNGATRKFYIDDSGFRLNSGGSSAVEINKDANGGTGGFTVCTGGATPTCPASPAIDANNIHFASAFKSATANPALSGAVRLAQADSLKFRNTANSADLAALSEAGDVLQVGEAVNGINVPGPANVANLTASGTVSAAAISTGGDSFANTPRIAWGAFLPGNLSTTWTAAQFTLKKAINVVQIDLRAKTAPAGCTTFPVVQITDGTTPINVTLNSAGVAQSVTGGQNYAANATLQVKVSTAGAGCTTNAADVNVTVQYKMQ